MAIPKITREEEQVLLSMGLLDFPLSLLTLQEMALLDGPSSPSDVLVPAYQNLSLTPFMGSGSVTPQPKLSPSVPATPSAELGSDGSPTCDVPDSIAPKSLARVDSHWEAMPHVREVTSPATIKFQTHEIEELDPQTGKIIRTRVIFPIIIPKEKETCISVPPLPAAQGQLNSLTPSPSVAPSVVNSVDGITSTTTTSRGPPTPMLMPSIDQVAPAPAIKPTRDVADSVDVRSSPPHRISTSPRCAPLTALTPPTSSPVRDFRSSRAGTPVGLWADVSAGA